MRVAVCRVCHGIVIEKEAEDRAGLEGTLARFKVCRCERPRAGESARVPKATP